MLVGKRVWRSVRRDVASCLLLAAASAACGDDTSRVARTLEQPARPDAGSPSNASGQGGEGASVADVDVSGTWLGSIATPPVALRIVLNLQRGADGGWTGTADSPDQASFGIPISSVEVTGDRVVVRAALARS